MVWGLPEGVGGGWVDGGIGGKIGTIIINKILFAKQKNYLIKNVNQNHYFSSLLVNIV